MVGHNVEDGVLARIDVTRLRKGHHMHKQIKIAFRPQRFHALINRFHGTCHTTIKRDAKGNIVSLSAPRCDNPKCELNVPTGGEKHYA